MSKMEKHMNKAIQKMEKKLLAECDKELCMVYAAVSISLKRYWGWGQQRLRSLIDTNGEIWHECRLAREETSVMEFLENETGIELRLDMDGQSWHDIDFLNGKLKLYKIGRMTPQQVLYMRHRQLRWIGTMIQACAYLGLHRRFGFGPERIKRVMDQMYEVRQEFRENEKALIDACIRETGIDVAEVIHQAVSA
jgi:hypothetical protein